MSKGGSNEAGTPGYFLPEDGQLRLARLGDHIRFLSRLAQPHVRGEGRDMVPEMRVEELAICLELLAEQADSVLKQVSRPARREAATEAQRPVAGDASAQEAFDDAGGGFVFGVTLEQIDTLDRLIQTISAHGDVIAAGHAAELADHTMPLLGQAIHDGAVAVRGVLDQVEAQRLGQRLRPRAKLGEARGVYGAWLEWLAADGASRVALASSACPSLECGRPSRQSRLH